jgi:hypothetical protein
MFFSSYFLGYIGQEGGTTTGDDAKYVANDFPADMKEKHGQSFSGGSHREAGPWGDLRNPSYWGAGL